MRLSLVILGLFLSAFVHSQTLNQVREKYELGNQKQSVAEELASAESFTDPVMLGYKASAKIMLAKHYWNPIAKYATFVDGRDALEALISKHSNSFELRYLRLIIQCNCPSFLSYSDKIEDDKSFVIQNFASFLNEPENKEFASKVLSYLKTLNAFSEQEIETLVSNLN